MARPLSLGRRRESSASAASAPFELPPHHLVTHAAIVGMTGSGKTGLLVGLVEEALRSKVPVLVVDVKGDLPNLFLAFPGLAPEAFEPWVDVEAAARAGKTPRAVAEELAARWRDGLARSGVGLPEVEAHARQMAPRLLTPGTTVGEPVSMLSALEQRSELWDEDEELAREAVASAVSLLLRLVGREADAKSREHVALSHLCERRQRAGSASGLAELLGDLAAPPVERIGAMTFDDFLPPQDRLALAQELNALLAAPSFASWRRGSALDVCAWLRPVAGLDGPRTPAVVLSVAHLDDAERLLVLGLVLDSVLGWVRGLPGTSELRALVVFDEVFGFLPPHPKNPPTKPPLLALLKQARAFGVGVVLATQNPMDLDYKALSNAGVWFVGRLQTDADRARVVEGLAGAEGAPLDAASLTATLKELPPRTFFVRDVHASPPTALFETRSTLAWLRGPMPRRELARLAKLIGTTRDEPPLDPVAAAAVPAPAAALPVAAEREARAAATPAIAAAEAVSTTTNPAPVVGSANDAPATPRGPAGYAVIYARRPLGAGVTGAELAYAPWLVARVMAHVGDAKLGVARNVERLLAAPLGPDGRADFTRSVALDAALFHVEPLPDARFLDLPPGLGRKTARAAHEKSAREHVYRTLELPLDVHEELALARAEGESREAFVARAQAEAARANGVAWNELCAKHAPKIAKLEARAAKARQDLATAQAERAAAPGGFGTAMAGLFAGRRQAARMASRAHKADDRLERCKRDLAAAEAALYQAVAARDAELAAARSEAERRMTAFGVRPLRAKKNDVEVVELGLAWVLA